MPMSTNIHVPWGGRGGSPIWVSSSTKSEKEINKRTKKAIYINIPASSSKVGHRFGALHAPMPH